MENNIGILYSLSVGCVETTESSYVGKVNVYKVD